MGFKDTFTKEENDGLLGYDDTAFYYFASSILLVIAVPLTMSAIYNIIFPGQAEIQKNFPTKSRDGSRFRYCQSAAMREKIDAARREGRRMTTGGSCANVFKFGGVALLWLILYGFTLQMGQEREIKRFDPFKILEVEPGADNAAIKKAYRKLSMVYHPDKNPDDPLAATRFIEITKAHTALTDEAARRNYEKYGNPDGPQTTKVGIGLPRFLLEKDNQLMTLCLFFFLLIVVAPTIFICYYQRTKNYAPNGVFLETMYLMGYHINDATRLKNCPELLAASLESRNMPLRASDNTAMKPVSQAVVEHKKRQFNNVPVIVKNQFLIWAHMQRQHHLMSEELRRDCDELLGYSMKISQAMIEIACMREWFFTAQAMIEFKRSLVQALDVKSSQLLQIPHFNEECLKHAHRGKNAASSLADFLAKAPDERKGLGSMQPQELADVEAFAQHVSVMDVKAKVEVEDESDLVVDDVATVSVRLERLNLREDEATGPVHAPLFPEPKFEEWWLFLVEGGASQPRIMAYQRIRDTERVAVEKLRFYLTRPGKHEMVLHVMCDSYAGVDKKIELNFTVLTQEEVKREVFVHPEDEDLDLQPTLFQQFMGEFNVEEEESEEEDDNHAKSDKTASSKKLDLGEGVAKGAQDSDSGSDTEDEKPDKCSGGNAGNEAGVISSSSDSD